MGFFKKIGASIKKASKQISFKNLVKVATPLLGAIPFAGGFAQSTVEGLSAAHEAKKAGKAEEAEYLRQQTLANLGTVAGSVVGASAKTFSNALVDGAYQGVSQGVKDGVSGVGVSVLDGTLKLWFTKHWKHLLMALGGVIALVIIWKKFLSNPKGARRARR